MTAAPAPFLRRLVARVLDLVFALVLTFALILPVVVASLPFRAAFDRATWAVVCALTCYLLAYVGLELLVLVRRDGQTLGKGLMGLRVVPVREGARRIGPLAALVRLVVLLAPFALASLAGGNRASAVLDALAWCGLVTLLAAIVIAAVPVGLRRTPHDRLSGTRVVRAPKRAIAFRRDARMLVPGKVAPVERP